MKKEYIILSLFTVLALLLLGLGIYKMVSSSIHEEKTKKDANKTLLEKQEQFIKNNHYISEGKKRSDVHVVVFTDFRCSHCSKYYFSQKKKSIQKYIDSGKLEYTEIIFPVIDKKSKDYEKMARIFNDKGDINKLKRFADKSYQSSSVDNDPVKTVKRMNLNDKEQNDVINKYKKMSFKSNKSKIQKEFDIYATPTIYVNGKIVNDLSLLNRMIEKEIK